MPWERNLEWDAQIAASPDVVAVAGTRSDDRRSTVYLRRPGQMICDSGVWNAPRDNEERALRALLGAAGAEETRGAPRLDRDDERADAADRLGLTLLNVPDEQQPEIFREGRRLVPDALAYNHVMIAGPQRFGGDGVPEEIGELTVGIPATEGAGDRKVAVLDTGFLADAPFSVLPDSDIEPAAPDPNPARGHGTMVAGVLRRFAPSASILVRRVLKVPLGEADEMEVAKALEAVPDDVDIVNASFGGPAADGTRMVGLQRALDELPEETLVVAAAGNEGLARRHYMAAFKGVVAVGSAAVEEGQPGVCFYSNHGRWVDLSTQGSSIETVRGATAVLANGTSFAVPKIVARILAIADQEGISVRHAASWLKYQSGGPAIAGGGTFVDLPAP